MIDYSLEIEFYWCQKLFVVQQIVPVWELVLADLIIWFVCEESHIPDEGRQSH